MKIFFDLETIPASDEFREVAIEAERKKYRNKDIAGDDEALFRASALSGDFGRILCIGYAVNDDEVEILSGGEKEILTKWWQIAKNVTKFIGHNILEFDIPFIYKRSIVLKYPPSQMLPVRKFETENIYDTLKQWSRWDYSSNLSLHFLAKALSLESSKDLGIDGSQVYDYYLGGKLDKIYEYCKRDVELVRKVYKRMTFEGL